MTSRGRRLFDRYVSSHLNHPTFAALTIDSHAFNVATMAADARIPVQEIVEEIGPIPSALRAAWKQREKA